MASVFEVRDEVWEVVETLLPEVPEQAAVVDGSHIRALQGGPHRALAR